MSTARVHVKRARKHPALSADRARSGLLAGACLALVRTGSPANATPPAVLAVPLIQDLTELEHSVFLKLLWRM